MSALAFSRYDEPALVRSFALAALVHLFLIGVMFFGVRWQSHRPETVMVELWDTPPPPPAPPQEVAPPPPAPPKVEPVPPVVKPVIALKGKAEKPKPKAELKAKPPAKPKPDPEFDRRLREQVAQEQKALQAQSREQALQQLLARQQAEATRAAAAARTKALNEYMGRIQTAIRQRIRESELAGISGNPTAEFDVVQIPSGDVISIRMRKSSGHPRYDAEIERAIRAASPLPPPSSRELFERELKLTFRPLDK